MDEKWHKVKQKANCVISVLVRILLFLTALNRMFLGESPEISGISENLSEPYYIPYLITGPPPWKKQ